MDEWELMFRATHTMVASTTNWQEGLNQVVAAARANPAVFNEPDFWDRAERHDLRSAVDVVVAWSEECFGALGPGKGWGVLLLDLGDCPELFRPYLPGGQGVMSEGQFLERLSRQPVFDCLELTSCFPSGEPDPEGQLFRRGRVRLAYHNVRELDDELLSWNASPTVADFRGFNGYLLWLAVGSFALAAPLRDPEYCRRVLRGRDRLYLLAGFEQVFFHLGTATPEGIRHAAPPPAEP
jgi:hypothetical protein